MELGADEKLQDNDDRMRFIKWYEKSIHDARSIAKAFGGKALKGTAKQKEWAEKIRASKIDGMSAEDAELVCDPSGLLTHAHFWIEHRDKDRRVIAEFERNRRKLLQEAQALKAAGDVDGYAKAAALYNALTEKWGFSDEPRGLYKRRRR